MENQHKLIKGYRDLSKEEIDLMNKIKDKSKEIASLIDEVQYALKDARTKVAAAGDTSELDRINEAEPERWLALARTNFQVGFMELVRSVAQPTSF